MTNESVDVLIAGQGLAGSLLAYSLVTQGYTVRVLDGGVGGSSQAAAGLYNPITGRKMVKTWWADRLWEALEACYPALEEELQAPIFHPTPIFRPFVSVEENNDWQGRCSDPAFAPYIDRVTAPGTYGEHCHDDYGGILLRRCGWVDLTRLCAALRTWLRTRGCLRAENLEPDRVRFLEEGVEYADIRARFLVDCRGVAAAASDWWSWLPFRPVKGEVLEVGTETPLPRIYNRGVFVLPISAERARVGSTYHHELTPEPTEKGKKELMDKLGALLHVSIRIEDHWAGIRPATKDRRPLLGPHPQHPALWMFNGLGAKGVSLAPYLVQRLMAALYHGESLPPEVSLARFYRHYHA